MHLLLKVNGICGYLINFVMFLSLLNEEIKYVIFRVFVGFMSFVILAHFVTKHENTVTRHANTFCQWFIVCVYMPLVLFKDDKRFEI